MERNLVVNSLLFIGISLVIVLSFVGWGSSICKRVGLNPSIGLSFSLALGLYYFLSGVLCIFSLFSYSYAVFFIVSGLLLFLRDPQFILPYLNRYFFINFSILTALYIYIAPYAVPNFHDDYQKYFLHTFYLLNSGTLFYNPFGVGYETLGAFAFIQALYFPYLPLHYLLYCDFYLGFLVLGLFLSQLFYNKRPVFAVPVFLFLLFIPMQVVNSSPLYIPIVVMLSFFYLLQEKRLSFVFVGVLSFVLLVSKVTYLFFPPLVCLLSIILSKEYITNVKGYMGSFGISIVFSLPWILAVLPPFLDPEHVIPSLGYPPRELLFHFSTLPLFWGGNAAFYTLLILSVVLLSIPVYQLNKELTTLIPVLLIPLLLFALFLTPVVDIVWGQAAFRYLIPVVVGSLIFYSIQLLRARNFVGFVLAVLLSLFYFSDPVYTFQSVRDSRTFISFNHPLLQERVDLKDKITNENYTSSLRSVLDNLPRGSKVVCMVSNAAGIRDYSGITLYPYEFSSFQSPSFSFSDYDFIVTDALILSHLIGSSATPTYNRSNQDRKNILGANYLLEYLTKLSPFWSDSFFSVYAL